MKEYLRMDDVFDLPIKESEIMWMVAHDSPDRLECAVHAINSHDELMAEVERLRDALQDAYLDGCHYGWEMSAEGYNAEYGGPNDRKLHNQFIESYSGESYTSE